MKFKLYKVYYGDGSVSFIFETLRELWRFDRNVMAPNHNQINQIRGFTNTIDSYIGQIYQGKRGLRVRF